MRAFETYFKDLRTFKKPNFHLTVNIDVAVTHDMTADEVELTDPYCAPTAEPEEEELTYIPAAPSRYGESDVDNDRDDGDNGDGDDDDSASDKIEDNASIRNVTYALRPRQNVNYFSAARAIILQDSDSDTHWAAIITQVPMENRQNPVEDQRQEPLCFPSGAFKGSSFNCSVPKKKRFGIVEAICYLDYLISGHFVSVFTGHAKLVYLYDPYGRILGIARQTERNLTRWAINLSKLRYDIYHVTGELNMWADMLTRWAVKPKKSNHAQLILSLN